MIKECGIYYTNNNFYDIIRKLGGDCGNPGRRPIVCLVKSAEHPDLYWAIPMGIVGHRNHNAMDRINAFLALSNDDIRSCYYHLGRTTNRSIFFISDAFPIIEKYIEEKHLDINKNHYIIKNKPLLAELERKLFRILSYENAKPNHFRQHITDIKKYLIDEIATSIGMIAPCGNDCNICPKYTAKTSYELQKVAELWYKIGWSNKITSPEKTKCSGCSPSRTLCAIVKCHNERHINKCNQCSEFPCEKLNKLIQSNDNTKIKCKELCSDIEYEILHKAFFEKEANLRK